MKKVLSLVLVLAMVLGTFSFAFAAPLSDVKGTDYEEAVTRLASLEVLNGYPDGTFRPNNTITRAEFAKAIVKVLGLESAANAAKGATAFSDVPVDHWATGYINIASRMKYVKGMGNGEFAPEAPITYEQAVTLVMRALGYEEAAVARGGYPFGYLVVAAEEGVTDGVEGVQGLPASRGVVAQLLDNALEVPMMIQVGYGSDTKWVKSGTEDTDEVYLLEKLGVKQVEGRVVSNFRTNSKLDKNEIEIDVKDGKVTRYEVADNIDVDAILGLEVKAWVDEDIFKVSVTTDDDSIVYDTVDSVSKDDVFLTVTYDEFDWADEATVYVNNDEVKKLEEVKVGAYGRFVFNDDDEVVFAYLYDIDDRNTGVVTDMSKDEIEFISVGYAGEDILELDKAEEVFVFNKDLTAASLDDIDEDTAIFYWIDGDDNYYIVISDDTVEGELESVRVRDSRLTIDGTNVSKAAAAIYSTDEGESYSDWSGYDQAKNLVEENVVAYLNLVGDAMILVTDADVTSDTIYGVATWLEDGRYPTLTVFTNEGKEVDYDFEDRDDLTLTEDDFGGTKYAVVEFKLNKDGEIAKDSFSFVKYDDSEVKAYTKESSKKYMKDNSGNRVYITKDTVLVKPLIKKVADSDKLKPSLLDYDNIIDKAFNKESAIVMTSVGSDAGIIVFTDPLFEAVDTTMYGIVTSDPVKVKGGDIEAEIDVYGEGTDNYVLDVSDEKDVAKGDMIIFTLNNDGEVVLEGEDSAVNAKDSNVKVYEVTKKSGKYITLSDKTEYRVDDDTLFYETTAKGALDGTTKLTRISVGDSVIILADGTELKAVIDVTEYKKPQTTESGEIEFKLVSDNDKDKITVSKVVYNAEGHNEYVLRISGDALAEAVYTGPDIVDFKGDVLSFDIDGKIPVNGIYKIELIETKEYTVIQTKEKMFIEENTSN